jgi:hypothetical protein
LVSLPWLCIVSALHNICDSIIVISGHFQLDFKPEFRFWTEVSPSI